MPDEKTINLLRQIEELDGADAFQTKGKAPVMSRKAWEMLCPLADAGFVTLDESEMPILTDKRHGHILGRGFVSLTDAGRALIVN